MRLNVAPKNRYVDLLKARSQRRYRNTPTSIKNTRGAGSCRNAMIASGRAYIGVSRSPLCLQFFEFVLRQMNSDSRVATGCLSLNKIDAAQGIAHHGENHDAHRCEDLIECKAFLSAQNHRTYHPISQQSSA